MCRTKAPYTDDSHAEDRPVQSQLARQLADPMPKDRTRIRDLPSSKGLEPRWHLWDDVVIECRRLAGRMV